jgi:hypothetical protein
MISDYSISIAELIVTSMKDRFIIKEDWEKIKDEYILNYKINKDSYYYVPKQDDSKVPGIDYGESIDPDDIPF